MFGSVVQDLRYALRALRASPVFAAVAILSLALGIGADTAIFSLINAVMLKSLPVSHPEELLQVTMGSNLGYPNPVWEQLRDRQDVFSGAFAWGRWAFNLAAGGEARNVNGYFVSGQFFRTLGVRAALGRTLTLADDTRGCSGAAVLSYGFWQREYGGRGDIVGKTIALNGHPIAIVGVAEPAFTGIDKGASLDVMVPLCAEKRVHQGEVSAQDSLLDGRGFVGWLRVIGRPKPGIPVSQVEARLKTLAPEIYRATLPPKWRADQQERYLARTFAVEPAAAGPTLSTDQYRPALVVLMAITGVVLLIACATVANLLLARGAVRQREIAIRIALGSGRGRLIRQLLTESLLLSSIGAALGVVFAIWGTRLLVGYLAVVLDLTPDLRMLAFTATVAVITGLLFGMAPAWRGTRVQPQAAMKANGRGVIEGSRFGIGKVLVTAQVALSLLLVVGAGLMLSTFWRLASLDPGFDGRVLLVGVDLRNFNVAGERRLAELRQTLDKLRAIPGVHSASASTFTPICHCFWNDELAIDGYNAKSRADATAAQNHVSAGYFETLGTALVAGRDFNIGDTEGLPPVAVVNQALARKYFGEANPLGMHYRARKGNGVGPSVEIVGVVKDAKYGSLREEIPPTVFTPLGQDEAPLPFTNFELRPAIGEPTALIAAVKAAMGEVDGGLSMEFSTLAIRVNESIARERVLAALGGFFGALALLLAAIGLYGVISYNVARRRNEIGIRMALGAERSGVLRMVMGEVARLIGIGLVAGWGVTVVTTRLVASFLYGLTPNDPPTLILAATVLAGVALGAGYWPARQASRQDPMAALREE